jgi:L-threonylcarbamoyladenylate synthase
VATKTIKVRGPGNFGAAINRAARVILSGGVVALPTESFYGLAVDATNEKAIKRLLQVKKRRETQPILLLIDSRDVLEGLVKEIPQIAWKLMDAFWPGGLTLVFKAGSGVSPLLTGGGHKIGVRLSSHPIPTELARAAGVPITGTSANLSGHAACKEAKDVLASLGDQIDLLVDGGKTAGGKGSTVLDVTVDPPVILREGMVSRDQLGYFALANTRDDIRRGVGT